MQEQAEGRVASLVAERTALCAEQERAVGEALVSGRQLSAGRALAARRASGGSGLLLAAVLRAWLCAVSGAGAMAGRIGGGRHAVRGRMVRKWRGWCRQRLRRRRQLGVIVLRLQLSLKRRALHHWARLASRTSAVTSSQPAAGSPASPTSIAARHKATSLQHPLELRM